MGFIIRSVFWLSLVLLLIPIGGAARDGEDLVSPVEALLAARGAIQDVSSMCERKPDVCEVGRSAFHTIGVRAREGARMAYQALDAGNEDTTDQPTDIAEIIDREDAMTTGTVGTN